MKIVVVIEFVVCMAALLLGHASSQTCDPSKPDEYDQSVCASDPVGSGAIFDNGPSSSADSASGLPVCDNFDRADGSLGNSWSSTGSSGDLVIASDKVVRSSGTTNRWPISQYVLANASSTNLAASIDVNLANCTPFCFVAIRLGIGGSVSPLFLKIQSQPAPKVFCYLDINGNEFGPTKFLSGNPGALGTTFTLTGTVDSNGDVKMTFTNMQGGDFQGSTLVHDCGTYSDYKNLGTGVGIAMGASSTDQVTALDNFAHSGCGGGVSSTECVSCKTFLGRDGRIVRGKRRNGQCVERCVNHFQLWLSYLNYQCGSC